VHSSHASLGLSPSPRVAKTHFSLKPKFWVQAHQIFASPNLFFFLGKPNKIIKTQDFISKPKPFSQAHLLYFGPKPNDSFFLAQINI
jgi:hypothetical protein